MEYVYAALLLHKLGKPIDEDGLKKVISATGSEVDDGKVKLLSNALKDVDIDKELENAISVASMSAASSGDETSTKKEVEKEEKKEEASAAAEGLSSLFG